MGEAVRERERGAGEQRQDGESKKKEAKGHISYL